MLVRTPLRGYGSSVMSVPIPATSDPAGQPPVRHTVGEALDEISRMMEFPPATARDPATLPPWPEEDAVAFERAIDEACEQVDEPKRPPL